MTYKPFVSAILLGLVGALVALSPAIARPASDEILKARSGQIRLGTNELFSSDGTGVYASPGGLDAFLYDHRDGDSGEGENYDYLRFRPQKESYGLSSPIVDGDATTEGAQPVACVAEVIEFRGVAEKNWIEVLWPGGNLEGQVLAFCYTNGEPDRWGSASGYAVRYQDRAARDCAVVSRDASDSRKYTVDAPADAQIVGGIHVSGCAAMIHAFERRLEGDDHVWEYEFLGASSSPLNVTITLQKSV